MTTSITDWVLKVGWDASEVERGHRRLNTMFTRLNASLGRMEAGRTAEMRKQTAELQKQQRIADRSLARRSGMGGLAFPALQNLSDRRFRMETPIMKSETRAQRLLNSIPEGKDPRLQIMREQVETTASRLRMLRESLDKVSSTRGFDTIRRSLGELNTQLGHSAAAIGKMNRQLHLQDRIAMRLKGSLVNLAVGFGSVFAVIRAGQAFFRVGSEMESMKASMLAASGSAKQAAEDFQFVTNAALTLGVDLQESAHGYTQLGAAARAAGFSADETKNVFLAVTEASRAYGLSAERTNLVFLGFQQMISKGKISMEELRRQIGEQIPGAFSIAAKAMGVTTGELDRMVSKGELMPEQFITPFANALRQAVRESGALEAAMHKVIAQKERFFSMMKLGTKEGFDASSGLFGGAFQDLTIIVKENIPLFKAFGMAFGIAFKIVTEALKVVSTLLSPLVSLIGSFADAWRDAFDPSKSPTTFFEKAVRSLAIAIYDLRIAWLSFLNEFDKNGRLTGIFDALSPIFGALMKWVSFIITGISYIFKGLTYVVGLFDKVEGAVGVSPKYLPNDPEFASANGFARTNAQAAQAGVAGAGSKVTITDNSTNEFTLVGSPQENKRMLDEWWADRLTLASGVTP